MHISFAKHDEAFRIGRQPSLQFAHGDPGSGANISLAALVLVQFWKWPHVIGFLLLAAGALVHAAMFLPDRMKGGGLPFLLVGVGGLLIGIPQLLFGLPSERALWVGFILLGVGGLLGGISFLLGRLRLFGVAFLGFGVAGLVMGIMFVLNPLNWGGTTTLAGGLVGVALLVFGVGSLLAGLATLYRRDLGERFWGWLTERDDDVPASPMRVERLRRSP